MTLPKVTIAIPTLNRANYLKLAINSSLAQTYENLEIVISDNASNDGTAELLRSYESDARICILTQAERLDMVSNWNACLQAATGEYFLLLSDDDLLLSKAIEALVEAFEHGPVPSEQIGLAWCRGEVIDENGVVFRTGPVAPPVEDADQMVLAFYNGKRLTWPCTMLFRRSDIAAGYTNTYPLANDLAQWMQAVVRRGKAVFVENILAQYRMHRNTTAMTSVADWQRDLSAIAERVVGELKAYGRGSPEQYRKIHAASRRLNIRLIPDILNQRHGKNKWAALKAYAAHARHFLSPFGAFMLAVGLTDLLAPKLAPVARRMYRGLRRRAA